MARFLVATLGAGLLAAGCGGSSQTDANVPTGADQAVVQNQLAPAREGEPRVEAVPTEPKYREVTIPAGTTLPLRLASTLASDTSQVEDVVRATLRDDLALDGATVVPAGAELVGSVLDVERSGRVSGRARIAFRFSTLRHAGGSYDVRTDTIERMAEATKREDATKVGVGAGVGAALGAVLGGGSGAAKGAAVGAAAGTGAVLATRGDEIRLAPGDAVRTSLQAPVTLRIRVRG